MAIWWRRGLGAVALVLALAPSARAASAIARPTQGSLLGGPAGENPTPIPLSRTDVSAQVSAGFARVVVSQVFVNPHRVPIEAVYVFPLPARAAVAGAQIRVGGRTIRGVITARRAARDAYLAAKSRGQRVITVDEERPNVFTQSVANIPALGQVAVELEYHLPLPHRLGAYEFSFPMVVGPRAVPGMPDGSVPKGGGRLPDTDRVPDASRVTPPLLARGLRSGRDLSIALIIDEGDELLSVQSPSHELRRRRLADGREEVSLARRSAIANRDFVVRYRPKRERVAVMLHQEQDGSGFIGLTLPSGLWSSAPAGGPLPVIVVIDDSASMAGPIWAAARQVVRELIAALPDTSTVGIAPVSGRAALTARTMNDVGRRQALAYLDGLRPRRSVDAVPALRAALSKASRGAVVLVSDGWMANEDELAKLALRQAQTRVFPVLLGAAPNGHLAERMAAAGRGASSFLGLGEDPGPVVAELVSHLRQAPLEGVRVEWLGDAVHSATPQPIPPVYSGRGVHLFARFMRLPSALAIRLLGKGQAPRRIELDLHRARRNPALPFLWARERIAELELDGLRPGVDNAAVITTLGQQFHLLTAYTSFIAIDEAAPGLPATKTIYVPVDVPAGTRRERVLADSDVGDEEDALREAEKKPQPDGAEKEESVRAAAEPAPDSGAVAADTSADAEGAESVEARPVAMAPLGEGIAVGAGLRLRAVVGGGISIADDRAPLLSVELGASKPLSSRIGFGIAARAFFPLDSEQPARFALAPYLAMQLGHGLGLDLGAGPLLTSDGDPGLATFATGRWHLSTSLSLILGYQHDLTRSTPNTDAFTLSLGWTF